MEVAVEKRWIGVLLVVGKWHDMNHLAGLRDGN